MAQVSPEVVAGRMEHIMVGWCHALRNCRDNDDKEVAVNGLLGTSPSPLSFSRSIDMHVVCERDTQQCGCSVGAQWCCKPTRRRQRRI